MRALFLLGACVTAAALLGAARGPGGFRTSRDASLAGMPHPAPIARSGDRAAQNVACVKCHDDIAREWSTSLHKQANTDPAYQRALAIEPLDFCRGCHAPEADATRDAPTALGDMGVGCITCHTPDDRAHGATLAAPGSARSTRRAPHPVMREAEFTTKSACANCHEFTFPHGQELMQSTVTEHRRMGTNATCASCHMPVVDGPRGRHRKHSFEVTHDMIVNSVDTRGSRHGSKVTFTIEPRGVGHAVPTGDLFRRLVLRATVVDDQGNALESKRRYLTRHWANVRAPGGAVIRGLSRDDRPGGSENRTANVSFQFAESHRTKTIRWQLHYEKVEHPRSESEDDVVSGGKLLLTEGQLPP
jgi:hypothetical protein